MIYFWTRHLNWLKSTACMLLAALLFGMIAPPFSQASLWEDRQKALREMENKKRRQERPWETKTQAPDQNADSKNDLDAAGLQIPEEFGHVTETFWPSSATVAQPLVEMGRLGMERLSQVTLGKEKLPVKEVLGTQLIKRKSATRFS